MLASDILKVIHEIMNFKLFEINQTVITLASLIVFSFVFAGFSALSSVLRRLLRGQVFPRLSIDEGTQYTLGRIIHYAIMIVGAIVAFQFVGINLTGLAVVLGFLSVGIGFGLQNVTSNFVAGLILLFERPIKVGDRVTVVDKRET
ncbi:MAG TPA: mechanosensitive ion channel domain-containing protein [Terriglobales bacterium]|nr:mechanosensitive ion channel domain-containing protein [Terriglobales bacterium]